MSKPITQRTEEWYEFRKKHIGSSEIAAIVGLSPYTTVKDVWLEKTGRQERTAMNHAMLWGIEHEEQARQEFAKTTGELMMPAVHEFEEWPIASASLDGQSFDGQSILEIKCPQKKDLLEQVRQGTIPQHYLCQIQWQLMVTKASKTIFYVWHTDEFAQIEVLPDVSMQKDLLEAAKKFWQLVIDDVEPEDENKYIEIDTTEFIIAAEAWKVASAQLALAEENEKKSRAYLLDQTDGADCFGNGVKIDYIYPTGCIDYKKAYEELLELTKFDPKLHDLNKLRKKKNPYCRISLMKKEK